MAAKSTGELFRGQGYKRDLLWDPKKCRSRQVDFLRSLPVRRSSMNVVREIERINKAEIARIASGTQGGSWHDQYKDSAHIFIGGLPPELTEGDVITIFSQYGEPVDINLPRDKATGKARGFGFLMYEDQRSTILAVDNLNGAKVLNRTLRVDHVSNYKHLEKGEDGKFKESERETFNARPDLFINQNKGSDSEESEVEDDNLLEGIDPDDPMAAYLISQRKEERALAIANGTYSKSKKRGKHSSESKEERRRRKEERRRKREDKERRGGGRERSRDDRRERSYSRSRSPERPPRRRREDSLEMRASTSRAERDTREYDERLPKRRRDDSVDSRGSEREDRRRRDPSPRPDRARRPDRGDNDQDSDRYARRRSPSPDPRDSRDARRRERSRSRSRDRY